MRSLMALVLLTCCSPAGYGQAANPLTSCQVHIDPVAFGTYDALTGAPELSAGRIELRCLGSVTPEVRVILSPGISGRFQQRTLTNGANRLTYNLYADVARRIIAGDGTQGTSALSPVPADVGLKQFRGGLQTTARAVFRIYARLDPGQLVPAGEYTDTIQVTIEF